MNQNKKQFVEPSCQIVTFTCTDIIAVSENWYGGQVEMDLELPKIS